MVQAKGARRTHLRAVQVEQYLTVREVAALLKISTASVYGLCDRGEIEHVRVLNHIRIPSEAVKAIVSRP